MQYFLKYIPNKFGVNTESNDWTLTKRERMLEGSSPGMFQGREHSWTHAFRQLYAFACMNVLAWYRRKQTTMAQNKAFEELVGAIAGDMRASIANDEDGTGWWILDGPRLRIQTAFCSDPGQSRNGGDYNYYRDFVLTEEGVLATDSWSADFDIDDFGGRNEVLYPMQTDLYAVVEAAEKLVYDSQGSEPYDTIQVYLADYWSQKHQAFRIAQPVLYKIFVVLHNSSFNRDVVEPWQEGEMVRIGHYIDKLLWRDVLGPISQLFDNGLVLQILSASDVLLKEYALSDFADLDGPYVFTGPTLCFSESDFRVETNIRGLELKARIKSVAS